eukprot:CAMPEP_0113898600 /NCGR_PEP_ID=MMETSP0780_2-20120614/19493_1 /TAXON_ID=652834 /ORGANISM="Palpitomonas bilix" /LENGTH=452 /DNA_ID=CAMNT_0000890529 /DNA_START=178 /DNA_END=1536 /DNA_ORIENTATION=+ /assembly_acc=CAM_ASM_000599
MTNQPAGAIPPSGGRPPPISIGSSHSNSLPPRSNSPFVSPGRSPYHLLDETEDVTTVTKAAVQNMERLLSSKSLQFCRAEFLYSPIDKEFFYGQEFTSWIASSHVAYKKGTGKDGDSGKKLDLKGDRCTRKEWLAIKHKLVGKPRRLSQAYIQEERARLHEFRRASKKSRAEALDRRTSQQVVCWDKQAYGLKLGEFKGYELGDENGEISMRIEVPSGESKVETRVGASDVMFLVDEPGHGTGAELDFTLTAENVKSALDKVKDELKEKRSLMRAFVETNKRWEKLKEKGSEDDKAECQKRVNAIVLGLRQRNSVLEGPMSTLRMALGDSFGDIVFEQARELANMQSGCSEQLGDVGSIVQETITACFSALAMLRIATDIGIPAKEISSLVTRAIDHIKVLVREGNEEPPQLTVIRQLLTDLIPHVGAQATTTTVLPHVQGPLPYITPAPSK